jgi:hypothetical protein
MIYWKTRHIIQQALRNALAWYENIWVKKRDTNRPGHGSAEALGIMPSSNIQDVMPIEPV